MSNSNSGNSKDTIWREIILVLIGAAIAVISSYCTTKMQLNNQTKQFVTDKKLTVLKDYATSFNQSSHKLLSNVRIIQLRDSRIEAKLMRGELPKEDIEKNFEDMEKLQTETYEWQGNLKTQKFLVYATFGIPEELDSNKDILSNTFKSKLEELKQKPVESDLDGLRKLKELYKIFEGELVNSIAEENNNIQNLASKLVKEQIQ